MANRIAQLQFGRYVHPIYREQLHAVPDGWEYSWSDPSLEDGSTPTKRVVQRSRRFAWAHTKAEWAGLRVLSRAGYVHRIRAPRRGHAALIHSGERLLRNAPLPYVVDFEHAELFVLYQRLALRRPWARGSLARAIADQRCRRLLAWSEAARRSLWAALGPGFEAELGHKVETVYPAMRLNAERPAARRRGPLRVLFVGTHFIEKGGVEAVGALERVRASHDVRLDLLSYVPADWSRRLEGRTGLTLHRPAAGDVVRRLYREADVLLFPSHMDTFGVVVIEAMSHGLPVVAPDHLALAELVEHGESGLLFDPENMLYGSDTRCNFPSTLPPPRPFLDALARPSGGYVDGIAAALARLAEDHGLHERLATGAWQRVESGPFSIEARRGALARIYSEAAA